MSLFKPNFYFNKIWDISPDFLVKNNIKCLLIDVDNTLTTHDNPTPRAEVLSWLAQMKNEKIILMVISNNTEERVAPFARGLGIDYVSDSGKPLAKGVKKALCKTKLAKDQMLIIGDQIFTDVLCGKFSNVKTALVEPFELETMPFFKFKRALEKMILGKRRG